MIDEYFSKKSKEKLFTFLLNEANDIIILQDSQFNYIDIWASKEDELFFPKKEILGKNMSELFDKEIYVFFANYLQRVLDTKTTIEIKYRNPYSDHISYYQSKIITFFENEQWWLLSFIKNITEIELLNLERKRQLEFLTEAQRLAKVGSWEIEWGKMNIWWSDEFSKILELDDIKKFANFNDFIEFVHYRDRDFVKKRILDSVKNRTSCEIKYRLITFSKKIKYVKQVCNTYYDENAKSTRTIGTILDITEQQEYEALSRKNKLEIERQNHQYKLVNEELEQAMLYAAQSNSYFQMIFEKAPIGIFIFDEDGYLTDCNEAFAKIVDAPKKTLIGFQLFNDLRNKDISEALKRTISEKDVEYENYYETLISKKRLYLKMYSTAVYNARNRAVGGLAIVEDITPTINFQEELKVAKNKAEESNNLKSAFLANMSHEIRTPLNAILGFTQILKETKTNPNKQEKFLDIILSSGEHLLHLINDILDLSKVESGQMEIELSTFELNKLFRSLLTFFHSYKKQNKKDHLEIKLIVPPNDNNVYFDETKLSQILINLVSNAIKFTETGSVEYGYVVKKDKFVLFVSDTGIGIEKKETEIIFDRFSQSSLSPNNNGTGLGLALVKAYTDLLNGNIDLISEPNVGTTFKIQFSKDFSI